MSANLKKNGHNSASKFNNLEPHKSLVSTISEEKQIRDTILKLASYRVNASQSIYEWANTESNEFLRYAISQIYDINLMWAHVQREYAGQRNEFANSLGEILKLENCLDSRKNQLKAIIDKKEKIQNQSSISLKKKSQQAELARLITEEQQVQSYLEKENNDLKLFKNKMMKSILVKDMKSRVVLAEKVVEMYKTAQLIASEIPDNVNEPFKQVQKDYVSDLSERLDISNRRSNLVHHVVKSPKNKSKGKNKENEEIRTNQGAIFTEMSKIMLLDIPTKKEECRPRSITHDCVNFNFVNDQLQTECNIVEPNISSVQSNTAKVRHSDASLELKSLKTSPVPFKRQRSKSMNVQQYNEAHVYENNQSISLECNNNIAISKAILRQSKPRDILLKADFGCFDLMAGDFASMSLSSKNSLDCKDSEIKYEEQSYNKERKDADSFYMSSTECFEADLQDCECSFAKDNFLHNQSCDCFGKFNMFTGGNKTNIINERSFYDENNYLIATPEHIEDKNNDFYAENVYEAVDELDQRIQTQNVNNILNIQEEKKVQNVIKPIPRQRKPPIRQPKPHAKI